jgi:glycosyltransferase involved in cell wall biosynthesis
MTSHLSGCKLLVSLSFFPWFSKGLILSHMISVIIPALNEEKNIAQTLSALIGSPNLEIVLVDNGSTDKTVEIASGFGLKVIARVGTIASLRNAGVEVSSGNMLVFIDADVTVSESWHKSIIEIERLLDIDPMVVTGSRLLAHVSIGFLKRYWYMHLSSSESPYINSGHLITSRKLFNEIEGFNEQLVTAEDHDFCLRAAVAGATIAPRPKLVAYHEGYPKGLFAFVSRERWHGQQDVKNLSSFFVSKVAWVAAFNLVIIMAAATFTLFGQFWAIPIYFLTMYAGLFLLVVKKFGIKKISEMAIMPIVFYFYICGRTLSIYDRFFGKKHV